MFFAKNCFNVVVFSPQYLQLIRIHHFTPHELLYFVNHVKRSSAIDSYFQQKNSENAPNYSTTDMHNFALRTSIVQEQRDANLLFLERFLGGCPKWIDSFSILNKCLKDDRTGTSLIGCFAKAALDSSSNNKNDVVTVLREIFKDLYVSKTFATSVRHMPLLQSSLGQVFIKHLTTKYMRELANKEFVELMLYFNLLRINVNEAHRIENDLFRRISELSLNDAAVACLAFHKSDIPIRSAALVQKIADLLLKSLDSEEATSYSLSAIFKCMSYHDRRRTVSDISDADFSMKTIWTASFLKRWLAYYNQPNAKHEQSLEPWMRLALMCTKLRVYDREFCIALERKILATGNTRAKTIARCLFALAVLNHDPVYNIYEHCVGRFRAFINGKDKAQRDFQFLPNVLYALSLRDIYPLDLYDCLLSYAGLRHLDSVKCAMGLDEDFFLRDLYHVIWSVSIDRPEYIIPPSCEGHYRHAAQVITKSMATIQFERIHRAVSKELEAPEKVLRLLHRTLGASFVYFGYLLPHFSVPDMCMTRRKGAFIEQQIHLPPPDVFPPPVASMKPQAGESRHVLLLVNTKKMFNTQGTPLGILASRKRLLQRLDYRVVDLNLNDYVRNKNKGLFLDNLLRAVLDKDFYGILDHGKFRKQMAPS